MREGSLTGNQRYREAVGGQLVLQVQYNTWSTRGRRWLTEWRYATREDVSPETVFGLSYS